MKEITFEELIEPLKIGGFEGWYSVEFISTGKVKELLQQVREATIDEVLMHAREEAYKIIGNEGSAIINFGYKMKLELSTDRIKTEK